jgi:hypothetical protein
MILDDRFARALAGFASDEELPKVLNSLAYPDGCDVRPFE